MIIWLVLSKLFSCYFPCIGTTWSLQVLLSWKKRLNRRRELLSRLHHLYPQLSLTLHLPRLCPQRLRLQPKSPPARRVQGSCWTRPYVSARPLHVRSVWGGNASDTISVTQVQHIADDPPCRCLNRFCVERQSQGRYRVGEKMLFIRVSQDKSG